MCRAFTQQAGESVHSYWKFQKELIHFMGELACENSQQEHYLEKYGDQVIPMEMETRLTQAIEAIEARGGSFKGWRQPGESCRGSLF